MSNFFANMFGTIATWAGWPGVDVDFVPDGKGKTRQIKGQHAWLGLQSKTMQKYAYDYCYPVSCVVDRLADYDLTGVRRIVSIKGKNKEAESSNSWAKAMNKLLDQPNPLQSWEAFRGQQVVYKKVFGFCPVLPLVPVGFESQPWEATLMINIPPWCIDPILKQGAMLTASKIEDFIEGYRVTILGNSFTLQPHQIFFLEDGYLKDESTNYVFPKSKLVGLDMAVSNICAAMEADNVLLRKRGALGFITHDTSTKDATSGYIPMTFKEKKRAQRALDNYGVSWSQFQYAITRTPLKWIQTALDVKALGTKETLIACEKAICHRYAFPYVLYEETETTYANGDNAAATIYQTNVIPNALKDVGKYNKFFKATDNGVVLEIDFTGVAALQEDKKFAADVAAINSETVQKQYDANLITRNQLLIALGYDPVGPEGDAYKTDGDDPLAVKLGVGGTTALIETLANPSLAPDVKKNALVIIFGLDETAANKMVSDEPKEEPKPQPGIKPLAA